MKNYGQIISKLRKQANLTQKQLGEKLNVSYQAISKWENNLSEPDLETIEKICDIFNITISSFFEMANNSDTTNAKNNSDATSAKNNIETPINEVPINSKQSLKINPAYLSIGLAFIIIVLSLFAFLLPVNLSSNKIYELVNPAVFCITAEGENTKQAGSGFFINNKGLAVTNYHVIDNCTKGEI